MSAAVGKKKKTFGEIRVNLDFFIDFFCFLSVLLIGADRWGFSALDVNFRIDQVFLCIFAVLIAVKGEFRITRNLWVIAFAFFSLFSTVFAVSFSRGLLFYFSIIFNIVFLFYTFANYVRIYGLARFIDLWRKTCYVMFLVLFAQFFLKVVFNYEFSFMPGYGEFKDIPRFQIWFYEPSYLATYLSVWFSVAFYMWLIEKRRGYLLDIVLALIMFVISTSTTGFIAIALAVAVIYFVWLARGVDLKKILFFVGIVMLLVLFRVVFSDIYEVFIGRLFNSSLNTASGGRVDGWKESFHVFAQNPFFGVGAGNYGIYLGEGTEYVPTNVTLDLLATLGIFGTVAFYGLTVSLIYHALKVPKDSANRELTVALALGLIVFTVVLQVNQGYLRLYHWLFFGVLWGAILQAKQAKGGGYEKNQRHSTCL